MTDRNRTTRLDRAIPAHIIPTDEQIRIMGLHDTVVRAGLAIYDEHAASWDETLRLVIAGLVKANAMLRDELVRAGRDTPINPVLTQFAGHSAECGLVTGRTLRCTCGYLVTQDDLRWRS